jgi:hypothetical protein
MNSTGNQPTCPQNPSPRRGLPIPNCPTLSNPNDAILSNMTYWQTLPIPGLSHNGKGQSFWRNPSNEVS